MWPLRSVPPYSSVPWTNPLLMPGPFSIGEKSVPMGVPPRMSFWLRHPHVMPPHQSAPLVNSVKHEALLVVVHSALSSVAVQHGEIFASDCAVLRAYHGPDGHDIHPVEPSHGKSLPNHPVPSNPERRPHPIGQAVPLGPSNCSYPGSRGASLQNGW